MPADEIDAARAVADYDMNSMIATELRGWLMRNFGEDVPFLKLLNPRMRIEMLAERIVKGRERGDEDRKGEGR